MNHAHTLVSEAKTKADRIRGDSERELAAATQRRDSINAQLSNVRQMLAALGGVAVAGPPELTEPVAGQSTPAPVASQHAKGVTDAQGGKDVAKTVALDTSKVRDNEPKAAKATGEKLNDKSAGSGQTIGAKG